MNDVDDILVPRFGDTYIEEFRNFAVHNPLAAAFIYPRVPADFVSRALLDQT